MGNDEGLRRRRGRRALQAGLVAINGPEARGFSRSFDGISLNPDVTGYGTSQADIYQKFNTAIWQNVSQAKLQLVLQRSYSFREDAGWAGYSYDSPYADYEGAYNRSYTATPITRIPCDVLTGKVMRFNVPTTSGYSQAKGRPGQVHSYLSRTEVRAAAEEQHGPHVTPEYEVLQLVLLRLRGRARRAKSTRTATR